MTVCVCDRMQIFSPKTAHISRMMHGPERFQPCLLLDYGHEASIFGPRAFKVGERFCSTAVYVNSFNHYLLRVLPVKVECYNMYTSRWTQHQGKVHGQFEWGQSGNAGANPEASFAGPQCDNRYKQAHIGRLICNMNAIFLLSISQMLGEKIKWLPMW